MDAEIVRSAETPVLKLEGRWTIERAHELRHVLMQALKDDGDVAIELDELVETDISCLQVLCSACRTSLRLGKHLALYGDKPEIFRRAVHDAGFARTPGCHKDLHKSCLWIGGWES